MRRRPLIPHLLFGLLVLTSVLLFWGPLRQWVSLSLNDPRYDYIFLVPVISAGVMFLERREVFARVAFHLKPGLFLLAGSLALHSLIRLRVVHVTEEYTLLFVILSILLVWVSGFALCYGVEALAAARFPFLLLLLMAPIPFAEMDKIIAVLQRGSAEATYVLFKLAGVPMFRDGVRFELPGVGIEVAKECSSIHSGSVLFITALLLGHLSLKSTPAKVFLSLMAIPVAIFGNAVRIATLWFLGTKIDVGFLYGNLHRRGGILFSLISLSILMGFLWMLRKMEGRRQGNARADEVALASHASSQALP